MADIKAWLSDSCQRVVSNPREHLAFAATGCSAGDPAKRDASTCVGETTMQLPGRPTWPQTRTATSSESPVQRQDTDGRSGGQPEAVNLK
jgi:hypothetical protein